MDVNPYQSPSQITDDVKKVVLPPYKEPSLGRKIGGHIAAALGIGYISGIGIFALFATKPAMAVMNFAAVFGVLYSLYLFAHHRHYSKMRRLAAEMESVQN
jgi:hypothetical protein